MDLGMLIATLSTSFLAGGFLTYTFFIISMVRKLENVCTSLDNHTKNHPIAPPCPFHTKVEVDLATIKGKINMESQ